MKFVGSMTEVLNSFKFCTLYIFLKVQYSDVTTLYFFQEPVSFKFKHYFDCRDKLDS